MEGGGGEKKSYQKKKSCLPRGPGEGREDKKNTLKKRAKRKKTRGKLKK